MPEKTPVLQARAMAGSPQMAVFANGHTTVQSYCAIGTGVVITVDVAPLIAAFNT